MRRPPRGSQTRRTIRPAIPSHNGRPTWQRSRSADSWERGCAERCRRRPACARSRQRAPRRAARAGPRRLPAAATAPSGPVALLVLLAGSAPARVVAPELLVLADRTLLRARQRADCAGLPAERTGDHGRASLRLVLVRETTVPDRRRLLYLA